MPRRPPPSALRLFQGPLPPRSQPKYALPSMPCPTFYPDGTLPHRPLPPPRNHRTARPTHADLPGLALSSSICAPGAADGSTPTTSPVSSPSSATKRLRGPWDDSSSINLHVDVDRLLTVPKPVAVCV